MKDQTQFTPTPNLTPNDVKPVMTQHYLDALIAEVGVERGTWAPNHPQGATYVYTLTREQLLKLVRVITKEALLHQSYGFLSLKDYL